MNAIGNPQFRIMCEMWGVDRALEALDEIGMYASGEQIEAAREREAEMLRVWDRVFIPREE